jgi:ankyrin repeat protein
MNLVRNKKTTVKELKEKWKEWNDLAKSMSKIVSLEKDTIKLEYYRNSLGQTALHIAAYKSNLEVENV